MWATFIPAARLEGGTLKQLTQGLATFTMILIPAHAWAGTIAVTAPTVESNRYVVPIMLQDATDVSSLDFQLRYDPAVFTPVSITAGSSTVAAGKVVEAHDTEPGAYSVLVMGLNQTASPRAKSQGWCWNGWTAQARKAGYRWNPPRWPTPPGKCWIRAGANMWCALMRRKRPRKNRPRKRLRRSSSSQQKKTQRRQLLWNPRSLSRIEMGYPLRSRWRMRC